MENIKKLIAEYSSEISPKAIEFRRHFHKYPELSEMEFETSKFISNILTKWGIEHKAGIAGTGIKALIKGEKGEGKTIALRADMDALPITENSGVDFSSVNGGVMHACGHDIHMANLLGTVYVLNKLKSEFSGNLVIIFQPSEEKFPGGAIRMINEGVLENPKVDAIFGMHVMPEMPTGTVGFRKGIYMASTDEIYISIIGKGGHAANPHQNIDPVATAAQLLIALQQISSRMAPPQIPTVLSFGKFIADGKTNIIPDRVEIEGTLRTFNEEWRAKALEMVEQVCQNTAQSFGAKCEVRIENGYPFLYNNEELTERASSSAKLFLGEKNVVDMELRMTAEDFAYFAQKVPACFWRVGVGFENGETYNLHSPNFIANEDALETAIKTTSWLAFCELKNL